MNAACTGKYIAMCEGNGYWTDLYKFQKQRRGFLEMVSGIFDVLLSCDNL